MERTAGFGTIILRGKVSIREKVILEPAKERVINMLFAGGNRKAEYCWESKCGML